MAFRPLALAVALAAAGHAGGAAAQTDTTGAAPATPYTRGEAVGGAALSTAFALTGLGVDFLPAPAVLGFSARSYYHYATEGGASLPLLYVSPGDAAQVGGVQIGLVGGALALRDAQVTRPGLAPYWDATELFALHQGMYAAYATYREARAHGASDAWRDRWRPWTAGELVVAPLRARNVLRPLVIGPVAIEAAVLGALAAGNLSRRPPPATAARDATLGAAVSWDAGVTEEALFRGFVYEELELSLGRWPARTLDMTFFTLAHVPGEIGQPQEHVVAGLLSRALIGLLLELAYDDGGLPESVALHALWDVVATTTAALTGPSWPAGGLAGGARGTPTAIMVPLISGAL